METVASLPGSFETVGDRSGEAVGQVVELLLRGPLKKEALLEAIQDLPARHPVLGDRGLGGELQSGGRAGRGGEAWSGTPREIGLGPHLSVRISSYSSEVTGLALLPHGAMNPQVLGFVLKDIGYLYTCRLLGQEADPFATPSGSASNSFRQVQHDHIPSRLDGAGPESRRPAGSRRISSLPADRPRDANAAILINSASFAIDGRLASEASGFSVEEEVSEVAVYIAAFKVLLARLSGAVRVTVGLHPSELSALQGTLLVDATLSIVPVTTEVRMKLTGAQLVRAVQAGIDSISTDFLDSGFASKSAGPDAPAITEAGSIDLDAGPRACFRFCPQLAPECVEFLGLSVELRMAEDGLADHEAKLCLSRTDSGARVEWQYQEVDFDARTIQHWVDSYGAILRSLIEERASPLGLLQVVTDEQMGLLSNWNAVSLPVDSEQPFVHQLIAEHARRIPEAAAILSVAGELANYRQLEAVSNQLARELQAWGASRNVRVGIVLEPGFDLLVAHLAALKSGATCVPLHCGDDALDETIALADVNFIVSHSSLLGRLEKAVQRILLLDVAAGQIMRQSDAELAAGPLQADSSSIAYLIFKRAPATEPLGVVLSHRALISCLNGLLVRPGFNAEDRVVSFVDEESIQCPVESLAAFCAGAKVVLGGDDIRGQGGKAMRLLLESTRASVMVAARQTWIELLAAGWAGTPEFKAFVPAAELTRSLTDKLLEKPVELWVLYQAAGAAGWAVCGRIQDRSGIWEPGGRFTRRVIGRPVENTAIWVLDEHGGVCPIGAFGELHIGGQSLADGYFNRLGLTAESFIPDLVGPHQGQKLYLTGDRGRWRHDGSLECLMKVEPNRVVGSGGSEVASFTNADSTAAPLPQTPEDAGMSETDGIPSISRASARDARAATGEEAAEDRVEPQDTDWLAAIVMPGPKGRIEHEDPVSAEDLSTSRSPGGRSGTVLMATSLVLLLSFAAFVVYPDFFSSWSSHGGDGSADNGRSASAEFPTSLKPQALLPAVESGETRPTPLGRDAIATPAVASGEPPSNSSRQASPPRALPGAAEGERQPAPVSPPAIAVVEKPLESRPTHEARAENESVKEAVAGGVVQGQVPSVSEIPVSDTSATAGRVGAASVSGPPVVPAPIVSAPVPPPPVIAAPVVAAPVVAAPVVAAPVVAAPVVAAPVVAAPLPSASISAAPVPFSMAAPTRSGPTAPLQPNPGSLPGATSAAVAPEGRSRARSAEAAVAPSGAADQPAGVRPGGCDTALRALGLCKAGAP